MHLKSLRLIQAVRSRLLVIRLFLIQRLRSDCILQLMMMFRIMLSGLETTLLHLFYPEAKQTVSMNTMLRLQVLVQAILRHSILLFLIRPVTTTRLSSVL